MFEAAAARPLTVVSAGPGWGKTLAAAAWAASGPTAGKLAWVSLDEGDSDPRLFWSYVLAALRHTGAVPPENDLAELVPGPAVDEEMIRRILYGISQLPEPVVLVLDDFHNIHDADVLSGVAMLLRYPLPQRRLVLITRMDPVLSLHRLRAHDHPVEATRHAVSAADWALLSELLVTRVASRLVSVERQALGRVLDKLPPVVGEDPAEVHLCRAARSLASPHADDVASSWPAS
jgi:LuxR family maltose regulon positive regulatory protein